MYHYLKWAALSYFFKRNLRYILLILIALIGIYGSDSVYQDLKDYALATGQKEAIFYFLIAKWVVRIALIFLFVYSLMKLGVGKEKELKTSKKARRVDSKTVADDVQSDEISKRLEKFRGTKPLRRRSDLIMEKVKKKRR